jgi:hypothetical protein
MESASKIQSTYTRRVEMGLDSGNEPSPAGMLAVDHMIRAHRTFLYKDHFDAALGSKQYDAVLHDVIAINQEEPTIAVSSLFSVDGVSRDDDWVRVALNVFPLDRNESIAVFSYLPDDATQVRSSLNTFLGVDGHYQKYLLSKLILNNCENFVVSPIYYEKWSEAKRKAVTDYFVQTLFSLVVQFSPLGWLALI